MNLQQKANRLLAEWDDFRAEGQDVTPEELCRDFPELLAEVKQQIDAIKAIEQRFSGSQSSTGEALIDTAAAKGMTDDSVAIGDKCIDGAPLGKYRIVRKLGGGGQGAAYLALDPELQREVVVKVYDLSDPKSQEQSILKEGQTLAKIRSPFVAQCHSVERDGARVYLVMEYIAGRPLHQAELSLPKDRNRILRILEQIAEGLTAIHEAGLLHRDIKPVNIILGRDGIPRIVDFGISSALNCVELQTISGALAFMPPEQARGETSQMGPRADVFGLGAVLYWFLTGKPPHQGRDTQEVWEKAKEGRVIPPSQIKANQPRALERICLKALAVSPDDRFASAAEMQQALRRCRRQHVWVTAIFWILVLGLCLTTVIVFGPRFVGWGTQLNTKRSTPVSPNPAAVLKLIEFNVLVWSQDATTREWVKRGWDVRRKEALPVRNGDGVQIEVKLSAPAYVYLLWLDSEGGVTPLYPWNPDKLKVFDLNRPVPQRKPLPALYSPPGKTNSYEIGGERGLETILLLVRRQPLPSDAPLELALGLGMPQRFHNPQELVVLGYDGMQPVSGVSVSRRPLAEAKVIDDHTLHLMERLQNRFGFEIIRAVSFAHVEE